MRLAVFLPNWIGDVVMATPALRALAKLAGADGHVVGVMRPYVTDVLEGTTFLDEIVCYQKGSDDCHLSAANVYRRLRAAKLDTAVLMPNSLRTAWMAWQSNIPRRVGYDVNLRRPLLTTRLYEPRGWIDVPPSTVQSYLQLAYAVGCDVEPPRFELATTAADEQAADAVWDRLDLPPGDQVVVFNSGGAFGAAKAWPVEHFAALAGRIVGDWGYSVLVNCGPAEREMAREIVRLADDRRVVSLADEDLPIGLTKASIRRARMLVTTDSGPRFFGIAFGRPVVTLFGPMDPLATRTFYEQETCLSLGLDCQPCSQPTCPLGHHRCMRDLSVDMVYRQTRHYLETVPYRHEAA